MSLNNLSDKIISFFQNMSPVYLNTFGYLFVFLAAIGEALPIVGSVIPGQTIIIISGFLVYSNLLNLYVVLFIASFGAILGDFISFEIGKKWGMSFVKKYGKYVLITDKRSKDIQKLLKQNLGKTVFLGRYNSATRAFIPFIAGSMDINSKRFLFWNIITGILWSATWILVGYFAGESFGIVVKYITYSIVIATILAIIIWGLFKYLENKKHIFTKFEMPIVISLILSIFIFIKTLEDILLKENLLNIDKSISNYFTQFYSINLNNLILFITSYLGTALMILVSLYIFYYLYKKKQYDKFYFFLISIIFTGFIMELIKNLVHRIRPGNAIIKLNSFSFPSGHSAYSLTISLSIYLIFKEKIHSSKYKFLFIFLLIIYPLIIGFSRIYLNVHYFSDVIGGFSLSVIIVLTIYLIGKYYIKNKNKEIKKGIKF